MLIKLVSWEDELGNFVDGGIWFKDWFLPEHGITTSHCKWWCNYSPQHKGFYIYERDKVMNVLRQLPTVYTPKIEFGLPTNRGVLLNIVDYRASLPIFFIDADPSLNPDDLLNRNRGIAGKLSEIHFLATLVGRGKHDGVTVGGLVEDLKGNDFRLPNGDFVQLKLDRRIADTGNIYIQTHTRTKGTNWLSIV